MFYDSTTCIFFATLVLLYILIVIYKKDTIRERIKREQKREQKKKRYQKRMLPFAVRPLLSQIKHLNL